MKRVHPKLRHIAISVPDVARAQKFFEEAFGMEKVGNAGRGVYMSDGTINVALLDYQGEAPTGRNGPCLGLLHFGMWVDNLAEAEAQVKAAGGKHLHGRPPDRPNTFYEVNVRGSRWRRFRSHRERLEGRAEERRACEVRDSKESDDAHMGAGVFLAREKSEFSHGPGGASAIGRGAGRRDRGSRDAQGRARRAVSLFPGDRYARHHREHPEVQGREGRATLRRVRLAQFDRSRACTRRARSSTSRCWAFSKRRRWSRA